MGNIPVLKPHEVVRMLCSLGFYETRQKGKGDCKVFVVEDGCGREQGHITVHADGTVNKHGIFKKLKPPVPSKFRFC